MPVATFLPKTHRLDQRTPNLRTTKLVLPALLAADRDKEYVSSLYPKRNYMRQNFAFR